MSQMGHSQEVKHINSKTTIRLFKKYINGRNWCESEGTKNGKNSGYRNDSPRFRTGETNTKPFRISKKGINIGVFQQLGGAGHNQIRNGPCIIKNELKKIHWFSIWIII